MTSHNKFSEPIYIDDLGWAAVAGGFPLEFFDDKESAENKCFHVNAAAEYYANEMVKPFIDALQGLEPFFLEDETLQISNEYRSAIVAAKRALESFKEASDDRA